MTQVDVHEAKTHLSKVLDQAIAGEDVVIMRSGKPLVRLTPVETAPAPRVPGTAKGEFVVPADFNEPLPYDVLGQFEGLFA
jgi:prevent-host-death family protein